MKLKEIKKLIEKYINISFNVYQNDNEIELHFNQWLSIVFEWDKNEDITRVTFSSRLGEYEGNTKEHFEYALEFIEVNSNIISKYKEII